MPIEAKRFLHARFILAAADRFALASAKLASEKAIDRENLVSFALPNVLWIARRTSVL